MPSESGYLFQVDGKHNPLSFHQISVPSTLLVIYATITPTHANHEAKSYKKLQTKLMGKTTLMVDLTTQTVTLKGLIPSHY